MKEKKGGQIVLITENLPILKIHKMTRDQYNRELASDSYDKNALYLTPDEAPKITVDEVQGGHKITISDAEDSQSFDVLDGKTPVKGVDYWTEQEKNELIAEARREYYYNSVAAALTDINNNTWANGLTNAVGASVMACIDELGQVTLALLQDVTETSFMYVKKNTHLALGKYKINITNVDTCLLFYPNTNCKITATTGGIIKNTTGAPQGGASFIQAYGELHINGGVYSLTANPSTDATIFAIVSTSASKLLELNNCKITVTNPRITDAKDTRVIEAQGQELRINNSRLSVASYGPAWAVVQWGDQISVMDSTILAVSDAWNAKGIFTKDAVAKVLIENSTISATTKSDITTGSDGPAADGLRVVSDSTVSNIKNSRIFADAKGVNVTAGAFAVSISNAGIMHLKNVDVLGTHSGCTSSGKLYVSGGTFCGFCHGGFYIVRNEDGGEAFINDALIKCGNYNQVLDEDGETVLFGHFVDKYATEEMLGKIYAATYVGYDNNTAYFDGCTFDHAGVHFCVVLRGSSGEQNITVNISNSTIGDDGWIRVDNETHTLNVGVGTDITADKIRDKNGTSQPGWVVFTNKLYRKSSSEDVAVLHNYSDNQYIVKPATASVGQTIVVKAVDENGKPTEWETADLGSGARTLDTAITLFDETITEAVKLVDYTIPEDKRVYNNYIVLLYPVRGSTADKYPHNVVCTIYWSDGTNDSNTTAINLGQPETNAVAWQFYYNLETRLYRKGTAVFSPRRGSENGVVTRINVQISITEGFVSGTRVVIKGW